MTKSLVDFAAHYGYVAVFVGVIIETFGIPFPGETTLLAGAILAGSHRLSPLGVIAAGWLAAVTGPTLSYLVFRRFGRRLLEVGFVQRIYKPEHVEKAEKFFRRHGWWGVFGTRFVVFLRIFTGPLAGLHRMPMTSFMLANALGAAGWVTLVVAVGLLIGNNLDRGLGLMATFGFAGLGLVVAAGVGFLAWRWRRHRGR